MSRKYIDGIEFKDGGNVVLLVRTHAATVPDTSRDGSRTTNFKKELTPKNNSNFESFRFVAIIRVPQAYKTMFHRT